MRGVTVLLLALLQGCHSSVESGRRPARVDHVEPPADLRRRVEPPEVVLQTDKQRELLFMEGARVGGRKAAGEGQTWAYGGEVSAWYNRGSEVPKTPRRPPFTWTGVRASATYVGGRGVTDVALGPAFGFPMILNANLAWAFDPQRRAHGAQAGFEFAFLYARYARYGGSVGEGRVEFGLSVPLGMQWFSWYR